MPKYFVKLSKTCILFFALLLKLNFSLDIQDYSNQFDKNWSRFLVSNVFILKTNFYVSSVNVIYPIGLMNESVNKVGIRYMFFYLLSKQIEYRLKQEDFVCKVDLDVRNDYVNIKITIPNNYSVVDVLEAMKSLIKLEEFRIQDFYGDYLNQVYSKIKDYYNQPFNAVLWYFRRNVFSAHPYYFLSWGNPENIRNFTTKDLSEFLTNEIGKNFNPYFLVLLSTDQDQDLVYNFLFNHFVSNNNVSNNNFDNFKNFSSMAFDRYYYRKVEIPKTKVFSFYSNSQAVYFLYLFTAPQFNRNFYEYVAMLIIDSFLSDPMNGVIWRQLREKEGIIYSVYSEFPLLKYTSYYVIFTWAYNKNKSQVSKKIDKIIEKSKLTDEDIYYYKQILLKKMYFKFNSIDELSDSLIDSIVYKDKRISPFYLVNYITSIDNSFIREVYKRYLSNYYLFVFE